MPSDPTPLSMDSLILNHRKIIAPSQGAAPRNGSPILIISPAALSRRMSDPALKERLGEERALR